MGYGGFVCVLEVNQSFAAVTLKRSVTWCARNVLFSFKRSLPRYCITIVCLSEPLTIISFSVSSLGSAEVCLKVFLFFASPAKGCHSTLDYSSKRAHWSSKTARLPSQPPTSSWRCSQGCVAGSPREWLGRCGTTFYGICRTHLSSLANDCCQGWCPSCKDCKNTA